MKPWHRLLRGVVGSPSLEEFSNYVDVALRDVDEWWWWAGGQTRWSWWSFPNLMILWVYLCTTQYSEKLYSTENQSHIQHGRYAVWMNTKAQIWRSTVSLLWVMTTQQAISSNVKVPLAPPAEWLGRTGPAAESEEGQQAWEWQPSLPHSKASFEEQDVVHTEVMVPAETTHLRVDKQPRTYTCVVKVWGTTDKWC